MKIRLVKKFFLANIAFFVSAISLGCLGFCSMEGKIVSGVISGLFWAGFILGHIFNLQCNRQVKKYEEKKNIANMRRIPIFFLFASNRYAQVVDFLMLFFVTVLAAMIYFKVKNEIVLIIVLSQVYLFLNLHFVYNGRFMKYTKKRVEGERGYEQT
ncbi:MAG: hypothetical protein HFI74_04885 [Lachnospiraceae bacterium]|jgi:hypothetical protein|nr:hypothetical protein [Lachnospiraceae bacterium]